MLYSTNRQRLRYLHRIHIKLWLLMWICVMPVFAQTALEAETPSPESNQDVEVAPTDPSLYPSRNMRDKTLIAEALEDEGHWLDTAHGKILVLYRPTEARATKGALVLFHAAETPQMWPPILENLRRNLPRYGWETLAVTLPQAAPKAIPLRDKDESENLEDNAEDIPATDPSSTSPPASNEVVVTREQLIAEYINVSINYLHTTGQFNAVILFDNSSVYLGMQQLATQIKENKKDPNTVDGPLQALIVANLQPQEALTRKQLESTFSQKQLPVLDIFFAPNTDIQKAERDLHHAVAMRNKLAYYQPLITELQPKVVEDDPTSFILGRVRGFMKAVATGSEVKTGKALK